MNIIKYPCDEAVDDAIKDDCQLLGAVSHDGEAAYVGVAEEIGDHIALLEAVDEERPSVFFRLRFNSSTAEWTFSCPKSYNGISQNEERVSAYYRDGLRLIPEFLVMLGYFSKLKIKNAPPEIWEF